MGLIKDMEAFHERENGDFKNILRDALGPEGTAAYKKDEENELLGLTGIHVGIERSSAITAFSTWLMAFKDYSVQDVFALEADKSEEKKAEIRGLFEEFKKDLRENYNIGLGLQRAERLGVWHRRAAEKISEFRLPDEAAQTSADMGRLAARCNILQTVFVDLGQDTADMLTDPAVRAAYYHGAGGMMTMQETISRVHGASLAPVYMTKKILGDETQLAEHFALFQDEWEQYRGKRLAEIRTPGLGVLNDRMTMLSMAMKVGSTPEQISEAEAFCRGQQPTPSSKFSWESEMTQRREAVRKDGVASLQAEIDDLAFTLSERPLGRFEERLASVGDYQTMSADQKAEAAALFQEIFGRKLTYERFEPFFTGTFKNVYDLFSINGQKVNSFSYAAGAKGLSDADKEVFVQIQILKALKDPTCSLTLDIPQYTGYERMEAQDKPFPVSLHKNELLLNPAGDSKEIDYAAEAADFLAEGITGGKVNTADMVLGAPVDRLIDKALFDGYEDKDTLEKMGKDIYDCVFINGISVNDIFEEKYGNAGISPNFQRYVKNSIIMSQRMDPKNLIVVRPFDRTADTFTLQDPIPLGVGPDMKGFTDEQRREISERNRQFVEEYRKLSPEEREKDYPKQPAAPDAKAVPHGGMVGSYHEKIRSIDEHYQKMLDESRFMHVDSQAYKNMVAAAKAVHDHAIDFDDSSPASRAKMDELMGNLHEAAAAYAEKEAYHKTKRTGRGVSRKNTALSLMALTGAAADETAVTDRRLRWSDKKKMSLSELTDMERKANAGAFGKKAEETRKQQRRQRRHEQKKRETPPPQHTGT
ncbi:MAG: hypothetical protein K6G16_02690 [Lachnospiraceae bacterium]|nr:hypothetical protein [Lachnospiraceae bacterium]